MDSNAAQIFAPKTGTSVASVIIADDDTALAAQFAEALAQNGIAGSIVADWAGLQRQLAGSAPEAIVVGHHLAGLNVLNNLPELRGRTQVPIILLLNQRAEIDRIVALELGADDCLVKPVSGSELAARIRAHLRRARGPRSHHHPREPQHAPAASPAPAAQAVQLHGWRLEVSQRLLHRPDGVIVRLTATEFDFIALLSRTPGEPVARETLARAVQGRDYQPNDRSLDSMVYQIRRKIGRRRGGECIVAIRNRGYSFVGFPED